MVTPPKTVKYFSYPSYMWWKEGDALVLQSNPRFSWVGHMLVISVFLALVAYYLSLIVAAGILVVGALGEILYWWAYNPARKIVITPTLITVHRYFKSETIQIGDVICFKIFSGGNLGVSENSGAPDRLSAVTRDGREVYLMAPPSMDEDCQSHTEFYAELKKYKDLQSS